MAGDDHNKCPVAKISGIKANGARPEAGKYFLCKLLSLKVGVGKPFGYSPNQRAMRINAFDNSTLVFVCNSFK